MPGTDPQALVKPPAPRDFRSRLQKANSRRLASIMSNLSRMHISKDKIDEALKQIEEPNADTKYGWTVDEVVWLRVIKELVWAPKFNTALLKEYLDRTHGKVPLVVARKLAAQETFDLEGMTDEELEEASAVEASGKPSED